MLLVLKQLKFIYLKNHIPDFLMTLNNGGRYIILINQLNSKIKFFLLSFFSKIAYIFTFRNVLILIKEAFFPFYLERLLKKQMLERRSVCSFVMSMENL